MNLIRIAAATLTMCGALAAVPAIAQAREGDYSRTPVPGHVEPGHAARGGHEHREERARAEHFRVERERFRREHARVERERLCRAAREHGDAPWRMRELGCR
jgi:hypothetical protein